MQLYLPGACWLPPVRRKEARNPETPFERLQVDATFVFLLRCLKACATVYSSSALLLLRRSTLYPIHSIPGAPPRHRRAFSRTPPQRFRSSASIFTYTHVPFRGCRCCPRSLPIPTAHTNPKTKPAHADHSDEDPAACDDALCWEPRAASIRSRASSVVIACVLCVELGGRSVG